MALLDGNIDKLIDEERKNMEDYLRGAKTLVLDFRDGDLTLIKKFDKD